MTHYRMDLSGEKLDLYTLCPVGCRKVKLNDAAVITETFPSSFYCVHVVDASYHGYSFHIIIFQNFV